MNPLTVEWINNAVIPEAKLTRYLLVWKPKDDKSGFLAQAGYTIDNWQQLEKAELCNLKCFRQ